MIELKKSVLRFLIDGKAYSDGAIMKNFGLSEQELKEIYKELIVDGYLETYDSYEARKKAKPDSMNENHCGTACSSESCGCGSNQEHSNEKKCCVEKDLDTTKILVLTEKALNG